MRHRKSGRKFGRRSGPWRALQRSIVQSLFTHGRIVTTLARAKEFRSPAEKLITLARRGVAARERKDTAGFLHCYRRAIAELGGTRFAHDLAKTLFDDIAPQFRDRNGGYTRVIREARGRLGDNAPVAVFELVGYQPAAPEAEETPEGGASATGAAEAGTKATAENQGGKKAAGKKAAGRKAK